MGVCHFRKIKHKQPWSVNCFLCFSQMFVSSRLINGIPYPFSCFPRRFNVQATAVKGKGARTPSVRCVFFPMWRFGDSVSGSNKTQRLSSFEGIWNTSWFVLRDPYTMESLFGSFLVEVIWLIGMKYLLDFSKIVVVQIPFSSLVAIVSSKKWSRDRSHVIKITFSEAHFKEGKDWEIPLVSKPSKCFVLLLLFWFGRSKRNESRTNPQGHLKISSIIYVAIPILRKGQIRCMSMEEHESVAPQILWTYTQKSIEI